MRLAATLKSPIEQHQKEIEELRNSLTATQKVLEDNDTKMKTGLDELGVRISEQFFITQQYADKGDGELKRLLEAVAQAAGAAGPAQG